MQHFKYQHKIILLKLSWVKYCDITYVVQLWHLHGQGVVELEPVVPPHKLVLHLPASDNHFIIYQLYPLSN